jgi:hypothetical protein
MFLSLSRVLAAGSLCVATLLACGGISQTKEAPADGASGGTAGRAGGAQASGAGRAATLPPGFSAMPTTILCGGNCSSAKLGIATASVYIDPCCTGADEDVCGIDTTFLTGSGLSGEACAPRAQPGKPDASCPSPPSLVLPTMGTTTALDPMPGCCRADNGTCGVLLNRVTVGGGLIPLADLGLGCVDAASIFPGETPVPCGGDGTGDGGSGAGGAASGASGGAGESGEAGETDEEGGGGAP